MKLLKIIHLGLVSVFLAAVILPRGCAAVTWEDEAGPSRLTPSAPPEPKPFRDPPPFVQTYIKHLDAERIAQLPLSSQRDSYRGPYAAVPIYNKRPLYNTKTDPRTVEQALRDYGSVGILDPGRRDGRFIVYDHGRLIQGLLPGTDTALGHLGLDGNVHIVKKFVKDLPATGTLEDNVESLPHASHMPIIRSDSDSLIQMKIAALTGMKKFWYVRPDRSVVLIDPHRESLFINARSQDEQRVYRALTGYDAARYIYGEPIASIVWGGPLYPEANFKDERTHRIPLQEYPRFGPNAARDDMVHALQTRGRFRFYIRSNEGRTGYKVMVKNPTAESHTPMDISIAQLTWWEVKQEQVLETAKQIHLPSVV